MLSFLPLVTQSVLTFCVHDKVVTCVVLKSSQGGGTGAGAGVSPGETRGRGLTLGGLARLQHSCQRPFMGPSTSRGGQLMLPGFGPGPLRPTASAHRRCRTSCPSARWTLCSTQARRSRSHLSSDGPETSGYHSVLRPAGLPTH